MIAACGHFANYMHVRMRARVLRLQARSACCADLHKLGGVEVLIVALEPKQTDAVRAGAAHALGVAASNNEEVQLRLWDAGGEGIVVQLLEVGFLIGFLDVRVSPFLQPLLCLSCAWPSAAPWVLAWWVPQVRQPAGC